MDDTQQQSQQPTVADTVMSSMTDVAGMTPPPAPVMPATDPVAVAPTDPTMVAPNATPTAPMGDPAAAGSEDYSYAEDILNEILDSLDRIEAKLEAIEKKNG